MTSNQIAYWDLQERERANRENERLKAYQQAIDRKQAEAATLKAQSAAQEAYTNHLRTLEEVAAGYEPAWSKIFGSIAKGIGSIVPF